MPDFPDNRSDSIPVFPVKRLEYKIKHNQSNISLNKQHPVIWFGLADRRTS